MLSRRSFVASTASAMLAPSVSWSAVGSPALLTSARKPDGSDHLVGLSAQGEIVFSARLSARGHAAAAHPFQAEAVAIARRPGTFAHVIDCAAGAIRQSLTAPPGRHFYGHGAFSADGHLLFTTENDIATGNGRIGIWDRRLGYTRIDEFSSQGIGPHEIVRLPSGDLAVANGGIRTHPDHGREKLNLDAMRSNLAIFSPEAVLQDLAEVAVDNRLNSLRHIAVAPDGKVICGFQWQGDPFDAPALAAIYTRGEGLTDCSLKERTLRSTKGYIGSVCCLLNAGFALSAPRGGRVVVLDAQGIEMRSFQASDACGLASLGKTVSLATDGRGFVYKLSANGLTRLAETPLAFDNHLTSVTDAAA